MGVLPELELFFLDIVSSLLEVVLLKKVLTRGALSRPGDFLENLNLKGKFNGFY